ncbi:hypothetical protein KJ616_01340 [Patescibacteria group bacterium]|nr:hypothetical protein [Patescibacteria group bacterium]
MADNVQQNVTLEDLAGMIKRGFDENTKEHQEMRQDNKKMLQSLFDLRGDHEEIAKKVSQVAYRFEVQDLEKRVKAVEEKLGIK